MEPILAYSHVSKRYERHSQKPRSFLELIAGGWRSARREPSQDFWVLRDFSLAIGRGESVGIIGDNGVGKSTVLKIGARIVDPTAGEVTRNGRIGSLLEVGVGFHPDLTGRENIYLSGAMIGMDRGEMNRRYDEIVSFSGVEEFIDMPVRHYSSGMQIRLGFSVATSIDPDILLVDEVLSVGDLSFRRKCFDRIQALRDEGTSLLYVSHNLDEVREMCDRVMWLHEACVRADGRPDEVVKAYTNYALRDRGLKVWELGSITSRGRRFGTGGVRILGCTLLDAAGNPAESWTVGEPLIVCIDYRCERRLQEAVFGLSLYTDDGIRVATPNSPIYRDLAEGATGRVFVVIPGIALRPGVYDITVAVSDPRAAEYTPYVHLHRAYQFQAIAGESTPEAFVSIPSRWLRANDWQQVEQILTEA